MLVHPFVSAARVIVGTGLIPVDEFEDLFGAAGLLVARTEVGSLTYDVDEDGNGALDFNEFVQVMDKMK